MMKKLKRLFTAVVLLLSVICANAKENNLTEASADKPTSGLKTNDYRECGKATYYGLNYRNGRKTASGRPYDKNKLTAAHKTLPFGTVVKVTNKKNGKTVEVEITDRGPFVRGRIIDLSVAAAKKIGMIKCGVTQVHIDIVRQPTTIKKKI